MGFWLYLFIIFIKILDLKMVDTERSFDLEKKKRYKKNINLQLT